LSGGIRTHVSQNHGPRPAGQPIDMLVLHYTGMECGEAALARLCDPAAEVSAHYLIEEDGTVFQLVPEHRRAWHAGVAVWRGHTDINSRSVGIELVNRGHEWGYRPFAEAQIAALIPLCQGIVARYGIEARNVTGHSDIAPNRKEDPGEFFPWARLAAEGVGLWPSDSTGPQDVPTPELPVVQEALTRFGYGLEEAESFDLDTRNVVLAFQRRFRPERMDGVFDAECAVLLAGLLRQAGCEVPDGLLG